MEIRMKNLIES